MQFQEIYDGLPKAVTVYGEIVAYTVIEDEFYSLRKRHQGGEWIECVYTPFEMASLLVNEDVSDKLCAEIQNLTNYEVKVFEREFSIKTISSQLEEEGAPYGKWKDFTLHGRYVGFISHELEKVMIYSPAELLHSQLPTVKVDGPLWSCEGVKDDFKPTLISPIKYGKSDFEPDEEDALRIVTLIKEWDRTKHRREIEL
ncbi:hypothetical protein [Vibrio barjaei]|uniref:hypothetical protein n=1 Tax=Vibrio barjaei TaxID=1676683 RepID=UPI002284E9DC|nr:hypothetical protein [Vibrio barjaei]MCY9870480.1 hypothetical protein [Vibrio barjaei]